MNDIVERARQTKKKIDEKLSRGGGGGARFWRPEAGENKIRIMPSWATEGDFTQQFWREVSQHWNVTEAQKGPILCPKQTPDLAGACPICEFVDELKQDKTDLEKQKLAKDLKAKTAYLLNVVVLQDPEYTVQDVVEYKKANPDRECPFEAGQPKVQIYACPVSLFGQILGLIESSGQDITSLGADTGRDVTIKKIPNKDRFKTRYEVYPSFNASAFESENPVVLPELTQVGFQMDYDKMLDLLSAGRGADFASAIPSGTVNSLPSGGTAKVDTPPDSVDLEAQMRRELAGS